jgi:hypothetical protein
MTSTNPVISTIKPTSVIGNNNNLRASSNMAEVARQPAKGNMSSSYQTSNSQYGRTFKK